MKLKTITISLAALFSPGVHAQEPRDVLAQHLAPPQLIMQTADELGLSEEQRENIRSTVENAHTEGSGKNSALESAVKALQAELGKAPVNEATALEKLDALLEAERGMKQVHLKLMIAVNNALTVEQRKKLGAMIRQQSGGKHAGATEQRLHAKLERVKNGVEQKVQAGEHPQSVADLMGEFPKLMEQGKIDEAEALLEKALTMLGEEEKPTKDSGDDHPSAALGPDALKKEIESMRVKDVAWRKIAWKTCLLDAVRASREQKKPIVVWCFIDRPIDDKRC